MPRKAKASGSSPEKQQPAATTRRNTRGRGRKASEPAETAEVADEIPAHLLRGSDESSEQSDNDSDYGSPKKGRGRAAATRGRGRKAKEPPPEEPKPTPRPRRGRRAVRGSSPTATEEQEQNSQEEYVESANSQTTIEEHETSTMESTSDHPPIAEERQEEEDAYEGEQQQQEQPQEQEEDMQTAVKEEPVQVSKSEELASAPHSQTPPSPKKEEEEPKEIVPKHEEEEEEKSSRQEEEVAEKEKVSEVTIEQDQSNNDRATVNEEVFRDDEPVEEKDKDDDGGAIEQKNVVETIPVAAEKEKSPSPEVIAEDEMSKDAPEISMEVDQSDSRSNSPDQVKEPPSRRRRRSRSSSGEIHDDTKEDDSAKPKESPKKPQETTPAVTKRARSPIKPPSTETAEQKPTPVQRKRKWGARKDDEPVIAITTDSLANVIAEEVKPVPLSDVKLAMSPSPEPEEKRARTRLSSEDRDAKKKLLKERLRKQEEEEDRRHEQIAKASERSQVSPTIVVTNGAGKDRKVSLVSANEEAATKAPSPPKNQSSRILCITNLVRPLTFMAVKSLVSRTGALDDFWIDSIKSKCFVKYKTEDEAIETRHALHGVKWPEHNLKTLNVEFSTDEEMLRVIEANVGERVPGRNESREGESKTAEKNFGWSKNDASAEDRSRASRRVREWDVGKKEEAEHDENRERRRRRSSERESRREKERKVLDESTEKRRSASGSPVREGKDAIPAQPGRLLDDLFRKSKTVPCIYWLPLTEEQIKEKEEQRQKNIAEHNRRMEEMIKSREQHREKLNEERREREKRREGERKDRERKRSRSRSRSRRRYSRERRSNSRDRGRRYDRR